jgi:hypothetical protein
MVASDHLHPVQLKMFMSAKEILSQYQPLDADRLDLGSGQTTKDPGSWELNPTARTPSQHTRRTTGGSKLYKRRGRSKAVETDEQLWERKSEEAWDRGLAQSIIDKGVKKPVSLGTRIGESEKPQIVGGHHRIAVMAEEAPNELMPVIHYEGGLHQARQENERARKGLGGYRYT